jgi:putative transposase
MMWAEDQGIDLQFVIHDRDTKFAASFNMLFETTGAKIVRSPIQAPIANCYAESWIGTLKRECLNHFFCFSLKHLDHIVQTYVGYYNTLRPHQSLGNLPLGQAHHPPPNLPLASDIGLVHRRALLGGLLNHYERKAA